MADDPDIQSPQVEVFSHPLGDTLEAPRTNPALQLAQSLAETDQPLGNFLDQLGGQLQARQAAKAQADALRTHGTALADAVRSGQILPTQNPWYIHAYNKQAAQVQGQQQVSALQAQSQTWAERNDPAAFAAKWQAALGEIQGKITGTDPIDTSVGFKAAADPISQETLSQNQEYNVQRIQAERVQNATTVSTQTIMDQLKANPNATSDQLFAALEPQHKEWVNTGGTEHTWRQLVAQSFTGAAANMGDSAVVNHLRDPYLGGAPIANQADVTGKPIGLQLEQDGYWINRGVDDALAHDWKQQLAQAQNEGAKALNWANAHYGNDFAFGRISLDQLRSDLVAQGYSGLAIDWVSKEMSTQLDAANAYDTAQIAQYSKDPGVEKDILQWNQRALLQGNTPGLQKDLIDAVTRREITAQTAMEIMDRAEGQTHWSVSEARADQRAAQSLTREDMGLQLQRAEIVGKHSEESIDTAMAAMVNVGLPVNDPNARRDLEVTVKGAAAAWAQGHPTDIQGATKAGEDAANKWVLNRLARRRQQGAVSLQPGGNPRQ